MAEEGRFLIESLSGSHGRVRRVVVEQNRHSPSGPGLLEWELVRYTLK